MAFKPEDFDDILRVGKDLERMRAQRVDVMDAVQRAADQMRDIVDPPALRRLREDCEQMQAITTSFGSLPETLTVDVAKAFAAQHLIEMPTDYLAGLKDLMGPVDLGSSIAKSLMIHDSEIEALRRSTELFGRIEIPDYAKEIGQLSKMSIISEEMLATIRPFDGLADLLDVHDVTRSLVEYETGRLNRAYAGFSASLMNRPEWLASAPDFVRTTPGDAILTQAYFVRSVTTHEDADGLDPISWTGSLS